MLIERELKFTFDYNSFDSIKDDVNWVNTSEIEQGYLYVSDACSVRIRKRITTTFCHGSKLVTTKHYVTTKINSNAKSSYQENIEIERIISSDDYAGLIVNAIGIINKTRYVYRHEYNGDYEFDEFIGDIDFEFDLFENSKLGQLAIVEVELYKDEDIPIPEWITQLPGFKEVTNDPKYLNCNLF